MLVTPTVVTSPSTGSHSTRQYTQLRTLVVVHHNHDAQQVQEDCCHQQLQVGRHQQRSREHHHCRSYQSKSKGVYGYNPNVWSQADSEGDPHQVSDNGNVTRYVEAYRRHGYKYANLNPVAQNLNISKGRQVSEN